MENEWGSPIYNCWLTTTLNEINNMIIGKHLFVRAPVLPYLELEEKIFISFKVKLKSVLKMSNICVKRRKLHELFITILELKGDVLEARYTNVLWNWLDLLMILNWTSLYNNFFITVMDIFIRHELVVFRF